MTKAFNKIKEEVIDFVKNSFLKSSFISYALLSLAKLLFTGFQYLVMIWKNIRGLKDDFKTSGLNNYKLGRECLMNNNIKGAKFRFILANLFRPNSPVVLYHLALVYFYENNIAKSLIYIKKVFDIRNKFKPALELFQKIDQQH